MTHLDAFSHKKKKEIFFRYLLTKIPDSVDPDPRKLARAFRQLDNENKKEVRNNVRLSACGDCVGETIKDVCTVQE